MESPSSTVEQGPPRRAQMLDSLRAGVSGLPLLSNTRQVRLTIST